jgi:uncharacterized membrane protein HdeD (DUF308 family)
MNPVETLISSCMVLLLLWCIAGVIKGLIQGRERKTRELIREIFQCFLICFPLALCIMVIMRQHTLAISICSASIVLLIILCIGVFRVLLALRAAYNEKRATEKIIPEAAT